MPPNTSLRPTFPDGKLKALVMSYDDGSEHDRRLLEIFNCFGIKGTFHLNSGRLGQPGHVTRQEVAELYRGHEVASHTVSHPYLTELDTAELVREIVEDRDALTGLTGRTVRGLAYPFGAYDDRVVAQLCALGVAYARTIEPIPDFGLPADFLRLGTTCHHNLALQVGEEFLRREASEMLLMHVWGHSYELNGFLTGDAEKNWAYIERFCALLGAAEGIHFTTTIDLVEYLGAVAALEYAADGLRATNPSPTPVWLDTRDTINVIKPGGTIAAG